MVCRAEVYLTANLKKDKKGGREAGKEGGREGRKFPPTAFLFSP